MSFLCGNLNGYVGGFYFTSKAPEKEVLMNKKLFHYHSL